MTSFIVSHALFDEKFAVVVSQRDGKSNTAGTVLFFVALPGLKTIHRSNLACSLAPADTPTDVFFYAVRHLVLDRYRRASVFML